jgi:Tfp pilus assembly protein PilW
MQESGRIAMDIIGKAIRQADYKLDYTASTLMKDSASIAAIGGTNGAGNAADTLIIRHDPAPENNTGTRGKEINCEGENVAFPKASTTSPDPTLVEYGFHISNNQLFCDATPISPLGGSAIVDLIENMQITYGIKNSTKAITEYTPNPTADQLNNVVAIRVSLLIRSPSDNVRPDQQIYSYNGSNTITSTDNRLRHVYTSTFTLRNRQ